jgi:hypothetical protein
MREADFSWHVVTLVEQLYRIRRYRIRRYRIRRYRIRARR